MRFFLLLLFFCLCSVYSNAQPPGTNVSEIPADTIEGESTDSTIVYIIKREPVRIKERIEIQRSKLKKNLYFSFGLAAFTNTNHYKANNGMNEYVGLINSSTKAKLGYSTFMELYNAPKKNILGFMIEGKRIQERFRFTPNDNIEKEYENSYTYGTFGILIGRWVKKERPISYQLLCAPTFNYKFGVSGYSFDKSDITKTTFIEEDVSYHPLYMNFFLTTRILIKVKKAFVEIGPYTFISPFSMTKKSEDYSIRRHMIGLHIMLTHRIF